MVRLYFDLKLRIILSELNFKEHMVYSICNKSNRNTKITLFNLNKRAKILRGDYQQLFFVIFYFFKPLYYNNISYIIILCPDICFALYFI